MFCPSSHRRFSAGQKWFTQMSLPLCPWWECHQVIYVVSQRWSEWVSVRIKAQGLFVVLFCRSLWLDGSWRTEPWLSFPHPSEVSWCFHWLTDACVCVCDEGLVDVYGAMCVLERERGRENEFKWVSECLNNQWIEEKRPHRTAVTIVPPLAHLCVFYFLFSLTI